MAEDFKRLLAALAPEKRKLIGKELSSSLLIEDPKDARTGKRKTTDADEGARVLALLRSEVQEQEERIKQLVAEVDGSC